MRGSAHRHCPWDGAQVLKTETRPGHLRPVPTSVIPPLHNYTCEQPLSDVRQQRRAEACHGDVVRQPPLELRLTNTPFNSRCIRKPEWRWTRTPKPLPVSSRWSRRCTILSDRTCGNTVVGPRQKEGCPTSGICKKNGEGPYTRNEGSLEKTKRGEHCRASQRDRTAGSRPHTSIK